MLNRIEAGIAMARDTLASQVRDVLNTPRLWEREIARYEAADRRSSPPRNPIVFTGSSTIRFWKTLARDMAPLAVLNRGFGGAHLAHVSEFAERIVLPYAPHTVVLYAGDNDLGAWTGKTSDSIVEDFERFAELVHAALPRTRIYFVSIKPSRLRRNQWPEQCAANEKIAKLAAAHTRVEYVDIATAMLGGRPVPPRALFAWDGLHLSAEGYALWTRVLKPTLAEAAVRRRHGA